MSREVSSQFPANAQGRKYFNLELDGEIACARACACDIVLRGPCLRSPLMPLSPSTISPDIVRQNLSFSSSEPENIFSFEIFIEGE